tara:strand:- start:35 stop:505 length:471 start_codon:yes stop_codon:yes gene_type:complete
MVNYTETHTLTITDVLEDVTTDIRKILRRIELTYEIFSTIDEYKFIALIHHNLSQEYVSGETIRIQISLIKSLIKTNTIKTIDGDLFNILFKLTTYIKRRQYDFTPSYVEFDGESYNYDISEEQQERVNEFKEKHITGTKNRWTMDALRKSYNIRV